MGDIVATVMFYLFSLITVGSAVMVIASRNPVHSVFFLILAFFNSAGLFVLLGAEYIAMTLIIVYVGAVAVLFLFVVMMLDVDFAEFRQGFLNYLPIGALIGFIFAVELLMVVGAWVIDPQLVKAPVAAIPAGMTNTEALGRVLYTQYVYYFQAAGLVLLVAMIGAIVLTLRERKGIKRQDVPTQNARTKETAMAVKQVPSRAGVPEEMA